ncbi:MAG: glycoside hydrolase [Prevotella sp.]|nr:glycoside hydrolase [Prevotella sp.]
MKRYWLIALYVIAACIPAGAQTIDVSKAAVQPLDHYWSVGTCAGRANEGLRTSWVEQLRLSQQQCGFQYLRMHGLFDDDMCVYFEKKNGQAVYSWQYIDEVYDRMLALGVRPFVELSFFPKGIAADNSKLQMWYQNRVTPDRARYPKWHAMIKAFCQHLIERYGLDEVSQWYFEVWNEPNLDFGFFDGTKSDYFELYKTTAEAIKGVSSRLRVGGPATSNFIADSRHDGERTDNSKSIFYSQEDINKQQWKAVWMEEFLDYCAKEQLPVDFITCHAYPTDYALDPVTKKGKDAIRYVHSLRDDLNWLRKTLAASRYPNAEIHITEWSTSPSSRDKMHDLLPPAAYIVKAMLECQHLANSVMYWTFTDIFEEKGGGEDIFHGGFGMINFQGIVKPSFHAYRMLNQLGDEQLYNEDPVVVSRHSDTKKITAIAYNYPKEFEEAVPASRNAGSYMKASSKKLSLKLRGLKPGATFTIETLDKDHGNAYDAWEQMGRPHSPTREQTEALRRAGWNTLEETIVADGKGRLTIERTLQPWTVILVTEE